MPTFSGHRFFLSYRTDDDLPQAVVKMLREELIRVYGDGTDVFLDVDSIRKGTDWKEGIRNAMGQATAALFLIGDVAQWLGVGEGDHGSRRVDDGEKDWVYWEVKTAVERHDAGSLKLVMPVLLKEGQSWPPQEKGLELPGAMADLLRFQPFRASDREVGLDHRVKRLVAYVKTLLRVPATRQALLGELQQPLPDHLLQLAAQCPMETTWWPRFWLSLGVLSRVERDAVREAVVEIHDMLVYLAGCDNKVAMLRFLTLMLQVETLPTGIQEIWRKVWNRALSHPEENGWNFPAPKRDAFLVGVKKMELAPALLAHLHRQFSDERRGEEWAISGSLRFGWKKLRLTAKPVPVTRGDAEGKEAAASAVLRSLKKQVNDLMGESESALRPRVELFLSADLGMDWPWERALVDDDYWGGWEFRIVRRSLVRHQDPQSCNRPNWKTKSDKWWRGEHAGQTKAIARWEEMNLAGRALVFLCEARWSADADLWVNRLGMIEVILPLKDPLAVRDDCLSFLQSAKEKTCCALHQSRCYRESPFNDVAYFCDPFEPELPYDPNADDDMI